MMIDSYDVVIVGAGAAGLMCAIHAKTEENTVLVLDTKPKVGAKILMSGGTRCNVTNRVVTEKDFCSEKSKIVNNILKAYSSEEAIAFFEKLGVELIEEPGGKLFPKTHSGRTVLEALQRALNDRGIELKTGCKASQIQKKENIYEIDAGEYQCCAKAVVLATGGLSFPSTGSDGEGYEIAKTFGHGFVDTSPSLTPLLTSQTLWNQLSGLTLPCRLTLWEHGKKSSSFEGSFLFTHVGFSGPVVLNLSRHWIRSKDKEGRQVFACFLPEMNEHQFREFFEQARKKTPEKQIRSLLSEILPEKLAIVFLKRFALDGNTKVTHWKREDRESCIRYLMRCPLDVSDAIGYEKAEVTAGGIPLNEVKPATMESRKVDNLFFAGEILDSDGRIGGFNFQWAWSTGVVAARGILEK